MSGRTLVRFAPFGFTCGHAAPTWHVDLYVDNLLDEVAIGRVR